jgi:hypothetical protein
MQLFFWFAVSHHTINPNYISLQTPKPI